MNKRGLLTITSFMFIIGILFFSSYLAQSKPSSFEVTPSLFKVVLDQNEIISADIEIKNFNDEKNFILRTGNLDKIVYLGNNNLVIEKGTSQIVNVNVSGLDSLTGAHMGHISVSNGIENKIIPFVVSIQTPTQFFAINLDVAPDKKQLLKKEDLETDIKFFNIYDDEPHTLDVNYKIIDINGETRLSESEKITIGVRSSFTKKFSLPKDLALGDYVFVVSLDYLGTTTTASYLFAVVDKKPISFFNINILAWIVIIFAGITFFLVLYLVYERVTLFYQLRKQHRAQKISFFKNLSREKKKRLAGAKTEEEKRKIIQDIHDAKRKILNELKKRQSQQIKELKGIKKEDIGEKKKKILEWKKEGYSRALKAAKVSHSLKKKLALLKTAYSQGFIQKESFEEGVSNINSAKEKLKRKYL